MPHNRFWRRRWSTPVSTMSPRHASSTSGVKHLMTTRDRLNATIEALSGDGSADQLRARLAELTARQPAAAELFDADAGAARAELEAAAVALQQAIADCETHRKVAEAAAKQLGERETRVALLQDKLAGEQAQIALARDQLVAAAGDEQR